MVESVVAKLEQSYDSSDDELRSSMLWFSHVPVTVAIPQVSGGNDR